MTRRQKKFLFLCVSFVLFLFGVFIVGRFLELTRDEILFSGGMMALWFVMATLLFILSKTGKLEKWFKPRKGKKLPNGSEGAGKGEDGQGC